MVNLRYFTEDQLLLLDRILVKYEYEIKDRLSLHNLPISDRERLLKEFDLLIQISDHLQLSEYKIKE